MYAKDISTKIKSTLHTKARRGEYLGALDPYGYLRHPDDKHKLIINEETAPVVRRMFEFRSVRFLIFRHAFHLLCSFI